MSSLESRLSIPPPPHASSGAGTPPKEATITPLPAISRPSVWQRLRRNRKAQIGGALLLVIVALAVAAPLVSPYAPDVQDVRAKLLPPAWQMRGTWKHPLGTDQLGRDVLSRILYGARISLSVGLLATIIATVIGITFGVLAGYFGRFVDSIVMRVVDIQMAFPSILLALAVIVLLGPGLQNLVLVLGVTSWVFFSRIVRADVLALRHREFVEAARALGARDFHIVRRYIMPNLVGTITVIATLTIARTVIAEASLSFLGIGIQPPTPSWGGMLSEGRRYLTVAWWIATLPGLALMAIVIGVNLLGDALRDILDPRLAADGN